MQNQASTNARFFARKLRREMTDGERLLWRKLRSEQLGFKFRRQHPLGSYVADFACLSPKLIIEIDGSQHVDQQAYDAKRNELFEHHGFDVMRFPANLPFSDLHSMVEAIYNRLTALTALAALAPIPAFPQRGKEQEVSTLASLVLPLPPLGEGWDGGLPESLP
jgi:very-short-patch-repair endonuclease